MTTTETLSSVLEARNERGIRVAGEWRNRSKFRPPELPLVVLHSRPRKPSNFGS